MTELKPDRHLSVDETFAIMAQARRIRSEYLRAAVRQLLSWLAARWSRTRREGEPTPEAGRIPNPATASVTQLSRRPPLRRPLPPTDISRPRRLQTGTSAR